MEYQIDAAGRSQEVRVGQDDREVAVFQKSGFLIHNLEGNVDGLEYQMKLAAPWTGFRYLLRQGEHDLASAKKQRRMHAFEPDRPLIRHQLVEFALDVHGRLFRLTPEDRHGLNHALYDGDKKCGCLSMRTFEAQEGSLWQADLQAPSDWSVPLAAYVAWLAREGRSRGAA
jgi:hypothetical protein